MKKFFLLFALLGFVSVSTVSAQKKTCTAAKAVKGEKVCTKTAAAKLASLEADIEKRVCEKSGSVSYVRKSVCSASGKVSFQDVEFCSKSSKFVNVSPSKGGTKASCTKPCTKGSAKASAMKVSQNETAVKGKACCAGKSKASCAAKKVDNAEKANAAKAKLVKGEE